MRDAQIDTAGNMQQMKPNRGLVGRALLLCAVLLSLIPARLAHAGDFVDPKPEELSMTSLPGYPGASAVILYREQISQDDLRVIRHYERIKILTEEGKKYADVQLTSVAFDEGDNLIAEDIVGRTIHPDGKIIPFTGKPYLKVLEKGEGVKVQEKVFTLPDVEVGSIIEYRYAVRPDRYFYSPTWLVQNELYVKEAHFLWYPTTKSLVDSKERPITHITWFPILPDGAKIEHHELPGGSLQAPQQVYELRVKDVPPTLNEQYMPPLGAYSYRVLFNFSPYGSQQEFWSEEGKEWSKGVNKFADPGALKDAAAKAIAGVTAPKDQLQKIYDVVMSQENTHFTRDHDKREDKAVGMGEIKNAADVLSHSRGTPTQLTELFIGMARAAGFKAYAMYVPDRSEEIFIPAWMSFDQFDDMIAIVDLDGQEVFFDPGSRYCAFGSLAWQHTLIQGLRQTDAGTAIVQAPGEPYKANRTTRVANLTMGADGQITGKIDLGFTGNPALHWRQIALRGDEEGLRHELRTHAEAILPKSLEVEVSNIQNVSDYTKPLQVTYKVTGTLGSVTGKRVLMPSDLFLSQEKATFPHDKRELPVYFHYPEMVQDAVRVNLPSNFTVEAVPAESKLNLPKEALYAETIVAAPNNVTTRRDFIFDAVVIPKEEYANLRTFYNQFESKDQESIVLKAAPAVASSTPSGAGQ